MNILSLVPTSWVLPAAGIAILAIGTYAGVQTYRVAVKDGEIAQQKLIVTTNEKLHAEAALRGTEEANTETAARVAQQSENANENQRLVSKATSAAVAAATSDQRLLNSARKVAASSCKASPDSTSPSTSAADRLADVLGACTAELRLVGKAADNAILRGQLAERNYDALEAKNRKERAAVPEEPASSAPVTILMQDLPDQMASKVDPTVFVKSKKVRPMTFGETAVFRERGSYP